MAPLSFLGSSKIQEPFRVQCFHVGLGSVVEQRTMALRSGSLERDDPEACITKQILKANICQCERLMFGQLGFATEVEHLPGKLLEEALPYTPTPSTLDLNPMPQSLPTRTLQPNYTPIPWVLPPHSVTVGEFE